MPEPTIERKIETMLKDTVKGLASKTELTACVQEEVKKFLDAQENPELAEAQKALKELQDAHNDLNAQIKRMRRTRFAEIKTPDGMYNGVWGSLEMAKCFGLYVLSDIAGHPSARKAFDELGIERKMILNDTKGTIVTLESGKALSDEVGSGTALVPTEFIPNLIVLIEAYSQFRQWAQEWPMSSETSIAPAQTSDVTVYCPGAGVTVTASAPGFRNIGMNAQKWMTLTAIDSELTEDAAIAVGEVVGRSIARAMGIQEDKCGFVGDGTSTYFGIQGARAKLRAVDATVTNVKGLKVQGTAGAWFSIVLSDITGTAGLLPSSFNVGGEVAWICNQQFYYTVMIPLALAAGGTNANEIINTAYGRNPMYMGYPVRYTGAMPSAKEASDHCPLLFGNGKLGAYLGDRRALAIDQSKEAYFSTDQTGIRGTERVAINPHGVGDTTAAGPIVGLWADIA